MHHGTTAGYVQNWDITARKESFGMERQRKDVKGREEKREEVKQFRETEMTAVPSAGHLVISSIHEGVVYIYTRSLLGL